MSKTRGINAKAVTDMFRFKEKARSKIQVMTRDVLLEIGRRLVERSPVGDPSTWKEPNWHKGTYKPGYFINNWQVGIDVKPSGVIKGVDPSGTRSLERLKRLGRWPAGHKFYFVNNVPYARAIEYGWSKQAPQGVVGLVRREFQQIVKEVEAQNRNIAR